MNIVSTLAQMRESYDWPQVFASAGVEKGENPGAPKWVGSAPWGRVKKPDENCTPFGFDDVADVLASVDGDNDGPSWVCVVALKDGRFSALEGSCDYTGWDCQSGASCVVARSLADCVRLGVSHTEWTRLGVTVADLTGQRADEEES